jgi:tetratricopeptide (TPR) repeat protein
MNADVVEKLLDEGFSLLDSGQAGAACAIFERVCEIDPANAEAWKMRGAIQGESDAVREALECLETAINLDERDAKSPIIKARLLIQQGDYRDAELACSRSLEIDPDMADAWLVLGVAQVHLGNLGEAETSFRKALELEPDMQEAQANLERIHFGGEDMAAVIRRYENACRQEPESMELLVKLARAYRKADRLDEAIRCFEQAADRGVNTTVMYGLADALLAAGYPGEAEYHLSTYLENNPDDAAIRTSYAGLLHRTGNLTEAEKNCRWALKLAPHMLLARHLLGVILQTSGRLDEAAACFREVVQRQHGNTVAIVNLGVTLRLQGNETGAMVAFRKALEIDPGYAPALNMLGAMLYDAGKFTDAMACYNRALEFDAGFADAHWNRALLLLLFGDTESGWKEYEWRSKKSDPIVASSLGVPRCPVNDLTGRVVWVGREQGVGDEVMFAAGIPQLLMRTSGCILNCDERLVPLFARSLPGARVVSDRDIVTMSNSIVRQVDCELPMGSLPGLLAGWIDSHSAGQAYLQADPERIAYWNDRLKSLPEGLRIGISWRGGADPVVQRRRSIDLCEWGGLLEISGAVFISVQYGEIQQEVQQANARYGKVIHEFDELDPLGDLDDFSACLSALDLVISVDNATVHFAGALGVPCRALIPLVPDWRWGLQGTATSWYRSVSLIRRRASQEWGDVLHELAKDLPGPR